MWLPFDSPTLLDLKRHLLFVNVMFAYSTQLNHETFVPIRKRANEITKRPSLCRLLFFFVVVVVVEVNCLATCATVPMYSTSLSLWSGASAKPSPHGQMRRTEARFGAFAPVVRGAAWSCCQLLFWRETQDPACVCTVCSRCLTCPSTLRYTHTHTHTSLMCTH